MHFLNRIVLIFERFIIKIKIAYLSKVYKCKINFIYQGSGDLVIECSSKIKQNYFYIDETSHLKSNTYIECNGCVSIGKYFHTGRGLTILSSNHDYKSNISIPYSKEVIKKPVIIDDFVWCGLNVTILPGVHVGEGSVIGASSVVTKDIPPYAIVGGNPARILKYRDINIFEKLKSENKFF
jgi:acetyltransferase-like isoleucine patch superfamily enzyme